MIFQQRSVRVLTCHIEILADMVCLPDSQYGWEVHFCDVPPPDCQHDNLMHGLSAVLMRVYLSGPKHAARTRGTWDAVLMWGCSSMGQSTRLAPAVPGFDSQQLHQFFALRSRPAQAIDARCSWRLLVAWVVQRVARVTVAHKTRVRSSSLAPMPSWRNW